jgi:hypothetical protein
MGEVICSDTFTAIYPLTGIIPAGPTIFPQKLDFELNYIGNGIEKRKQSTIAACFNSIKL